MADGGGDGIHSWKCEEETEGGGRGGNHSNKGGSGDRAETFHHFDARYSILSVLLRPWEQVHLMVQGPPLRACRRDGGVPTPTRNRWERGEGKDLGRGLLDWRCLTDITIMRAS